MARGSTPDHTPACRLQYQLEDRFVLHLVGVVDFLPNHCGEEHLHPFTELLCPLNGGIQILEQSHQISAKNGSLAVIPSYMRHQVKASPQEGVSLLYIGFSFQLDSTQICALKKMLHLKAIPPLLHGNLNMIANMVRDENVGITGQVKEMLFENILRLTHGILFSDNLEESAPSRELTMTRQAQDYLAKNLHRVVTVKEVADMCYLSPHYFGEVFHKCTGVLMKQYHNSLRMEKAVQLLLGTLDTITAISLALGFDSVHTFSRTFRQHFGISPSELRKRGKRLSNHT